MNHFYLVRFVKSSQNQPIYWVLWGLKGMHPHMQLMLQACQSITAHPQRKWNKSAVIISTMDRSRHHNVSFLSYAQKQPICWALWALKGMHPDMQIMPEAFQTIAMHQKDK